jgi:hypothetical protein
MMVDDIGLLLPRILRIEGSVHRTGPRGCRNPPAGIDNDREKVLTGFEQPSNRQQTGAAMAGLGDASEPMRTIITKRR